MIGFVRRFSIALAISFLTAASAYSQFVLSGTDDGSLKWMSISSDNYEVIYPVGCDSLAMVYLKELEQNRHGVAASLGMTANEGRRNPLPVVMHVQNAASNGAVTWTPRRMELNTLPEWTNPSPMPWSTMLAIHEGRHAAQMVNGYRKVFKPFYYILGEITPGAAAAWPGSLYLEGDAVIAETALTQSGRGRSSDFLRYYNYAFDAGDMRNWMRWRFGSYYNYTPDYYAFGYTILSGIRTRYDAPLFMADYFDYVSRRPYDPWPFRHTLRRTAGKKFKESYPEILTANYDAWKDDAENRGPFMPQMVLSEADKRLTKYSNPNSTAGGDYLWVKEDLYHTPALIRIDGNGKKTKLFNISRNIGRMNVSEEEGIIFWNELRRGPRWRQKVRSVVRSYDLTTGKRRTMRIVGDYNCPVPVDGNTLAVIHYMENGSHGIDLLNRKDGSLIKSIPTPDSLQILSISCLGATMYAAAISACGSGLYKIAYDSDVTWREVLAPKPFKVNSLKRSGDALVFESDMNGVNEFYRYDPSAAKLTRLTGSRYGAVDYNLCSNGDVSYSMICKQGSCPAVTGSGDLVNVPVKWGEYYHNPVADTLSAQEAGIKSGYKVNAPLAGNSSRKLEWVRSLPDTTFSAAKRYRKLGHGVHLHSWAPLYVDIDKLSSISYDNIKELAHLGAMAFFQNDLSTFSGWAAYQAKYVGPGKGDCGGDWRNVGHLSLTYSGLYPEFEAYVHVNEDFAKEYKMIVPYGEKGPDDSEKNKTLVVTTDKPRVRTGLTMRIPLSWDDGVLQYGVVPYAGVVYTNDMVYGQANILYNAGARAYVMRHTPSAAIYPRLGIGAEYKWADACSYAYLYGYVPGAGWGQGLRLSGLAQKKHKENYVYVSSYANLLPRGYAFTSGGVLDGYKLTADYAAPFYMGDWHIADAFYCSRGIITPHFDCSWLDLSAAQQTLGTRYGDLWSVGATFEMEFAAFFWIRTPITIGVTYSYNGGSLYNALGFEDKNHNYVGVTFSTSLF